MSSSLVLLVSSSSNEVSAHLLRPRGPPSYLYRNEQMANAKSLPEPSTSTHHRIFLKIILINNNCFTTDLS